MLKYRRPTDRDAMLFVGFVVLLALAAAYFTGLQPP